MAQNTIALFGTYDERQKWRNENQWYLPNIHKIMRESEEMITLVPKDGGKGVKVFKEVLCSLSPYYTAALKGNFLEAQKTTLSVDLSADHLAIFKTWLFTSQLADLGCDYAFDSSALIYLYIFADQTELLALRRSVMTALVDLDSSMRSTYNDITVAFKNLPKTSPLRNCFVVLFANHFLWYDESFEIDQHDGEVLKHLQHEALNMTKLGEEDDEETCSCCHKKCNWHEHESLPEWKATCGDVWPKPRTLEPEEKCMRKTFPTYSTDAGCKKPMSFN